MTFLSFSTLNHDLCIFRTCYDYVLRSLDLGESIDDNYGITRPTKNICAKENDDKCVFYTFQRGLSVEYSDHSDDIRNFFSKLAHFVGNGHMDKPSRIWVALEAFSKPRKFHGRTSNSSFAIADSKTCFFRLVKAVERVYCKFWILSYIYFHRELSDILFPLLCSIVIYNY